MRDDFTQETKNILGNRVGWKCSNPSCRKATRGAADDESKYINIGVAAHICAASEGGPRYDVNMRQKERKSYSNGIWLCQSCSKLIDSDVDRYSVEILQQWKKQAEERTKEDLESQRNFDKKEFYTLKIKSFSEVSKEEKLDQSVLIDLTDYFEGRFLKDDYSWKEIVDRIKSDLHSVLEKEKQYIVKLITHYPIAFIAGRIMNPKSALKTIPAQNTINGNEVWEIKNSEKAEYEELNFAKESMSEANVDLAVVISITRNIRSAAKEYIVKKQLAVGEIYYLGIQNLSIDSVKDGEHAWRLAKQIDFWIGQRSINNKKGKLHIFFAGPISIMFQLGKMSLTYGKGCIYDYDLEKTGTYYPTISFLEDDWI